MTPREKAELALLKARVQARDGRKAAEAYASKLQEHLWSRGYAHAWGTRDEFVAVLQAHPDLLALPIPKSGETLLSNLAMWAPHLAQKESRAKSSHVSEDARQSLLALTAKLEAAISTRTQVGRRDLRIEICTFASTPDIPPGLIGISVHGTFMDFCDSADEAGKRASQIAQRLGGEVP